MTVTYRRTNKTVYSANYHLIWCPKHRRRVLGGAVENRLVEVPPVVALSKFIGALKGRSARVARHEFDHLRRLASLWTPSWFCSTVGGAPLEVVRRYLENQKLAA